MLCKRSLCSEPLSRFLMAMMVAFADLKQDETTGGERLNEGLWLSVQCLGVSMGNILIPWWIWEDLF